MADDQRQSEVCQQTAKPRGRLFGIPKRIWGILALAGPFLTHQAFDLAQHVFHDTVTKIGGPHVEDALKNYLPPFGQKPKEAHPTAPKQIDKIEKDLTQKPLPKQEPPDIQTGSGKQQPISPSKTPKRSKDEPSDPVREFFKKLFS
jgi:hypothetical protein